MDFQPEHKGGGLKPEVMESLSKNRESLRNLAASMFEALSKKDLEEVSSNSGAGIFGRKKLILDFFSKAVVVDIDERFVFYQGNTRALPGTAGDGIKRDTEVLDIFSTSLVLHYLNVADGSPVTGKWISYRELPGGLFYSGTIPSVVSPLTEKYQKNGKAFINKALETGGRIILEYKYGVVIYPFIRFPVMMIFDEKDEEFVAGIRLLFDKNSPHYMNTDVIKMLIVYIVRLLL